MKKRRKSLKEIQRIVVNKGVRDEVVKKNAEKLKEKEKNK